MLPGEFARKRESADAVAAAPPRHCAPHTSSASKSRPCLSMTLTPAPGLAGSYTRRKSGEGPSTRCQTYRYVRYAQEWTAGESVGSRAHGGPD